MRQLKYSIQKNEKLLDADVAQLEAAKGRVWTIFTTESAEQMLDHAMGLILCGKDLNTLVTSYEEDVKLYKDTRAHLTSSGAGREIQVHQGAIIASTGSGDNILRTDDRIVASKNVIIAKISQYNGLLKAYRSHRYFCYRKAATPQFIEM